MSLAAMLQKARSEEDVKDAYIKALGLKGYQKGLIDIQTKEVWFEAKEAPTPPVTMFAQLLSYVRAAQKNGEQIPPFLAVIDREKAAIMETQNALPLFKDKNIVWGSAASQISKDTIKQIQPYIEAHFVVYKIQTHETEFVDAVKTGIKEGRFIRTPITPDNLKQVFDKWVDMIGKELDGVDEVDYALMFYADIMHDGKAKVIDNLPARLVYDDETPIFVMRGTTYELSSVAGYRRFWAIYHRPPSQEYREYLLERRDSLLPIDERSFKGAYYTPLNVVDRAYDKLTETLGKNWQKNYIVWDMCCGVGNLEVKHSNHRNVFMSTLDKADIDVMHASRTCVAATRFQYDYLNDDIDEDGNIDYSISKKLPKELQKAIVDLRENKKGAKKILVLINPPYAEAMHSDNTSDGKKAESKVGVAATRMGALMERAGYGYAARELFVQFVARIQQEIPGAVLAMFSKLKYVNAPNFEEFRERWHAEYLGGFIVHSKVFDGLKGDFPIGFLVWDTAKDDVISSVEVDVLNKNAQWQGVKSFFSVNADLLLGSWIDRPRANNVDALPLKNAVTPTTSTKDVRGTKWADGAIGSLICKGSDLQNAGNGTALLSSGYCSAGSLFVTPDNLPKAAVVFAVRRLISQNWVNDRDQFLQPIKELPQEFIDDCLIWMLFNGSNLAASANNLEWNGKKWDIVNHFIPFSEAEVNAKGRFESSFMVDYLDGKVLSEEAVAVMNAGRDVWRAYFAADIERKIRQEYKLNRPDVGWYQIRRALEDSGKESGSEFDFGPFKAAYEALSSKLRPQVFEFGFLR